MVGLGALTGAISAGAAAGAEGAMAGAGWFKQMNPYEQFFAGLVSHAGIGAVTGGVTSEIVCGQFLHGFGQGAWTAAYGFIFNSWLHSLDKGLGFVNNAFSLSGDGSYYGAAVGAGAGAVAGAPFFPPFGSFVGGFVGGMIGGAIGGALFPDASAGMLNYGEDVEIYKNAYGSAPPGPDPYGFQLRMNLQGMGTPFF
jgi:hypothetical protein